MEKTPLMRLDLRKPLVYKKISFEDMESLVILPKNEEIILCFKLNPLQSSNIEINRELFLESLVFTGQKIDNMYHETKPDHQKEVVLPQGIYLFVQERSLENINKVPHQIEWLDMAIEQQKDGLWERNKLDNLLFVRFLHEDGAFVTQVFRPIVT
jgi:hypothetical protein